MRSVNYFWVHRPSLQWAIRRFCAMPYCTGHIEGDAPKHDRMPANFAMTADDFLLPIQGAGPYYADGQYYGALLLCKAYVLSTSECKALRPPVFHRVYVKCPLCDEVIPASRLQQHMAAKTHEGAIERVSSFVYPRSKFDACVHALQAKVQREGLTLATHTSKSEG